MTPTESPPKSISTRDRVIQALLFVAVGISLVITLWGMDLGHLWAALKVADWRWLAVAVLANVASQVSRAVGWNAMFTEFRIRFPLLVRIEFAVQAAAAVSPEGVGERPDRLPAAREGGPVGDHHADDGPQVLLQPGPGALPGVQLVAGGATCAAGRWPSPGCIQPC